MIFQKLEITDKEEILPYFKNNNLNLCVYSPLSILVWRAKYYYPVYMKKDSAVYIGAEFTKDNSSSHMILPVTPEKNDLLPENLHKIIKNTDFRYFKYVPESYLEEFGLSRVEKYFEVKEITADSDYVYLKEKLADLGGRKLAKKRNLINQFLKEYKNRYSFTEINDSNKRDVLDFLEIWCRQRDCEKDPESDIYCEKKAAENAVLNCESLGFKTLVLEVDNEIRAFALSSVITSDMGALHFQKACFKIKGLYQFFDKNCASRLFDEKIKFINKESDMDDEGLRHAKKSYYPEKIIKSYNLVPR